MLIPICIMVVFLGFYVCNGKINSTDTLANIFLRVGKSLSSSICMSTNLSADISISLRMPFSVLVNTRISQC